MKMKNLIKSVFRAALLLLHFVILRFALLLCCFVTFSSADSWVEKPDIDFYAHPFVESQAAAGTFFRGKIAEVKPLQVISGGKIYKADKFNDDVELKKGERVVCEVVPDGVSIVDYDRFPSMFFLLLIFAGGVILLNFATGIRAVLALALSIAAIVFLFLPLVEKGFNPVFSGIFICVIISLVTLCLIGADKKKTLPAFLGTLGGISAVFVFAKVFLTLAKFGGFSEEQIQLLNYLSRTLRNIQGIFLAGIIIGATGVIMDVAISISSSLLKIRGENPDIKGSALFSAGMNIGRDIIASMANSLLFAYIGGALFLLVSRSFFTYSFTQLLNAEWFSVILVEIFSGTFGIIAAVPLTSFVSSKLLTHSLQ